MASFGSKKEFSKRDMNFFAEFTAAAARATRLIGYGVVLMVVAVVAIILTLVFFIVRNIVISNEVKQLEATLASDEYKNVRSEAEKLSALLEKTNNYYYSLFQMQKQVDTTPDVKMAITDLIGKSIPSDTRITNYDISGTALTISGETFLPRSADDFLHELNKNSEVFTTQCDLSINRVSPENFGDVPDFLKEDGTGVYSDVVYHFDITGTLVNEVWITVSRFSKEDKKISSLGMDVKEPKKVREVYQVPNLVNIEVNNVKYELVGITRNGRDIKKEDFERIKSQGEYSIVMTANTDIGLYYSEVKEKPADNKTEGENKESEATK
jgi:hypothetical protein